MSADLFDQLQTTLRGEGPAAAIDRLCERLRASREYNKLFYARLMKKRVEMGVSPVPTGPSTDVPEAKQAEFEEVIRESAREAGGLCLADGDLPQAWVYYRMIGEPEPVRAALDAYQPGEDEDVQPLVGLAFYEGVHPTRGFDWVLSRYGLCNAITTASGEMPFPDEVKHHCVRSLIRALYAELRARLTAEIEARWGVPPAGSDAPADSPGVVRQLITDRDWLFEEEAYHIDTSHLSSVVHLSMSLPPCPELHLARELCAYGAKLSGRFLGEQDPPFDNGYADYEVYLSVLAGDDVEAGLAHFRAKAGSTDKETYGTGAAEVLVNLLLRVGRGKEAVAVAREHLSTPQTGQLSCPGLAELCQRFGEYGVLAEAAREQGDALHYLAGLIAAEGTAAVTPCPARP